MFYIFGTHYFGSRNYAYKWMECKSCKMPRVFIQSRAFAWGHLFWIPLVPLGYEYNWHCTACAKDDNRKQTPMFRKFTYLLVLTLILLFVMQYNEKSDLGEALIWWQVGIGSLILWTLYAMAFHFSTKKKTMKKYLLPLEDKEHCEVCDGKLEMSKKKKLQCEDCHCYALDIETK